MSALPTLWVYSVHTVSLYSWWFQLWAQAHLGILCSKDHRQEQLWPSSSPSILSKVKKSQKVLCKNEPMIKIIFIILLYIFQAVYFQEYSTQINLLLGLHISYFH